VPSRKTLRLLYYLTAWGDRLGTAGVRGRSRRFARAALSVRNSAASVCGRTGRKGAADVAATIDSAAILFPWVRGAVGYGRLDASDASFNVRVFLCSFPGGVRRISSKWRTAAQNRNAVRERDRSGSQAFPARGVVGRRPQGVLPENGRRNRDGFAKDSSLFRSYSYLSAVRIDHWISRGNLTVPNSY
jgi:hypothetical protein